VTNPAGEGVRRLREALGGRVSLPGSAAYAAALGRVFFPDAARRRPACVVQPASAQDVSAVMRIAQATGCPVTVRGGGLSSNCVADDAIMMNLSVHLDRCWSSRTNCSRARISAAATDSNCRLGAARELRNRSA
jgi:hypothetical protein